MRISDWSSDVCSSDLEGMDMNYTLFGKTGLNVSPLALGTGNFGTGWGHGADPETAGAIFNAYAEAGGNFIDTADVYQFGQRSEEHTSELQSLMRISYAVFCLKKKNSHTHIQALIK